MKVENAVNKLNQMLPLKERQSRLDEDSLKVHRAILYSFVEKGRPPYKNELSGLLYGQDVSDILKNLSSLDLIIVNNKNEPVGSYPMTSEDTKHKVKVNGHDIQAMCALDALGISLMFGYITEIQSKCHVTGEVIGIKQINKEIIEISPSRDVHFGIIWSSPTGCCAHSLCTEMVFLKDKEIAHTWQMEQSCSREIFTLSEALDFTEQFFVPLVKD